MASIRDNILNLLTWYLENLKNMFANEDVVSDSFSKNKDYEVGDYCLYDNILYEFTENKEAGEWDASVVEKTDLASAITKLIVALNGFSIRYTSEVPTEATTDPMTIYLIPEK